MLPPDVSMWEHLDESVPTGYQDSLVMHMIYKPVQISFDSEEDRYTCTYVYVSLHLQLVYMVIYCLATKIL